MTLPLFAVTLFVSAFLLFLVQPMIGKMILPKLGGTPQVWNTCMLFFQCVLLAGYAYTHFMSTWLTTRRQLLVHGLLLLVPLVFLVNPFNVRSWTPDPAGSAVLQALVELALIVGVPFFVVSTSAPLLQRWFTTTGHPAAKDPYFLYGASNLGSLLSLVFYPFLMEPWIALGTQSFTWAGGYAVLVILVLVCIAMVWKSAPALRFAGAGASDVPDMPPIELADPPPPPAPAPPPATAVKAGPAPGAAHQRGIQRRKGLKVPARTSSAAAAAPSMLAEISRPAEAPVNWWRRTRWVLLAMVPSSLMLGVTTYISVDVSPFPLVWAVPLALYLLSFILVYMKWPIPWTTSETGSYTPHSLVMFFVQPVGIIVMCWILLQRGFDPMHMFIAWGVFFATALACHGELAKDRPDPKHLTEYFLLMSIGGALGGFFNAIVAPALFNGIWEFYITLCLACFVRPVLLPINWLDNWLMNQFPGLQSWARDQSDQLSRSFGKPADGSTYVLSFMLDLLLGCFVLGLCWLLRAQAEWGWFTDVRAGKMLMFFGVSERTVVLSELDTKFFHVVLWGLPLLCCFFFAARPIRFGLGITAILTYWLVLAGGRDDTTLFQGRTYFGVLRVLKSTESLVYRVRMQDKIQELPKDREEYENFAFAPGDNKKNDPQDTYNYTYLMHGTTYHGRNYTYTPGDDKVDLSRLATTYYHRYGPVGVVMERHNWLPGPQNSFWADARMPATMVGHIASTLGTSNMPLANLANVWTEPPYATIGLGTGTMASYSRTYQHMVYYEIDEQIRKFSLPPSGPYRFTYLRGAIKRGVNLEVIMGDARLSMYNEDPKVALFPRFQTDNRLGTSDGDSENPLLDGPKIGVTLVQDPDAKKEDPDTKKMVEKSPRERYYKVIVVDAFSSDAIPIHLCTLEAIDLYLHKLAPDGVLCMHTSNRHMNLVRPIAKIVEALDQKYQNIEYKDDPLYKQRVKCKYGQDDPLRPEGTPRGGDRSKFLGQFGSNYVMIYHDEKYLKPPDNYTELYNKSEKYNIFDKIYDYDPGDGKIVKKARSNVHWGPANARESDAPWTDDYSNIVSIIRWPDWLVRRSDD